MRRVLIVLLLIAAARLPAQETPLLAVITVPATQFAAVTNKLADKLIEQGALPNTPKWRSAVLEGWQDYVKKDDTSVVVKVYCDSVQHMQAGIYKVTPERIRVILDYVGNATVRMRVTRDLSGLMEEYGLVLKKTE
jgi:hypothetical protein